MVFLYILLPLAIVFSFIFFGLWMREKRERADEKYDREHQEELGIVVEKEKSAQIDELNRTIQDLSDRAEKERNNLKEWNSKIVSISLAYHAIDDKVHDQSAELANAKDEKIKLLQEKEELLKAIEDSKTALSSISLELEKLKDIQRTLILEGWKDKDNNLWELPLNDKENELILILNRIKTDYPDIRVDISTIEWRKIWLPKLQDLGNSKGLSCRGIYRLVLKSDEKICYVGQAVNIQDRWYQHVKKMIGADAKGAEKLYNYRPEDFYWSVLERGPQVDLNKSEKYWIEYFGCKEVGLNKKL